MVNSCPQSNNFYLYSLKAWWLWGKNMEENAGYKVVGAKINNKIFSQPNPLVPRLIPFYQP